MGVMLYPCILCVSLLMDLFLMCVACLTVFVNCLVKQFAMCLGVVDILLFNVMDVFSVCGGDWVDHVWCSKECVCSAYDPNVHISAHSIVFFVCRKFKSLRAGSQVFVLLMLSVNSIQSAFL